jgi:hypothetical protein
MYDSEKNILEAMSKLSEQMQSYDKRLTSMGSDLAKVQSQMELSMKLIQPFTRNMCGWFRTPQVLRQTAEYWVPLRLQHL